MKKKLKIMEIIDRGESMTYRSIIKFSNAYAVETEAKSSKKKNSRIS